MTWRDAGIGRAVDEALAYIRATWNTDGIVVAGSIVRGEAGPTSDLDIHILHGEPWRVRDQRRFAGVPAELFVNPPDRVRAYFVEEHADGAPSTAHMFATGEVLEPSATLDALVREARAWLAKPLDVTAASLTSRRYGAVDMLDNARDMIDGDPAVAHLLLVEVVRQIIAYAFWQRALFQPRQKDQLRALAAIDPTAAAQVRAFVASGRIDDVIALARHVLGVDAFFAWTSERG